jgi:hypothetical protein
MKPANIALHIEELVLHGFAPGDRYRIAAAVERELQRLFAEQGVPPFCTGDIDSARMDAGAFNIASGSTAEACGAQVAQALYRGLSQ